MKIFCHIACSCLLMILIAGCGEQPGKQNHQAAAPVKETPAAPSVKPSAAGAPLSCYEAGLRVGRCAAKSMSGLPCDPADEIKIPAECEGKPETEKGKTDGRHSVH